MTREDAAEVILKGYPWISCSSCKGIGNDPTATKSYRDAVSKHNHGYLPEPHPKDYQLKCASCGGSGTVVVEEYREACLLLGKSLPEPPSLRKIVDIEPKRLIKLTFKPDDQG